MSEKKLTDEEIVASLECCGLTTSCNGCALRNETFECSPFLAKNALDLINRQKAEIEALQMDNQQLQSDIVNANMNADHALAEIERLKGWQDLLKAEKHSLIKADAVRKFAEKIDGCLERYSHLHKYAEQAMRSTEEYADGSPMEMVSVWEVLTLKKWEMCEYETMTTLQENIETIAKERLLSEIEKDFRLLKKEMVGEG